LTARGHFFKLHICLLRPFCVFLFCEFPVVFATVAAAAAAVVVVVVVDVVLLISWLSINMNI